MNDASRYSEVDTRSSPPRVVIPRHYNAAVDLLDRHVEEGRGSRIAVKDDRGETTYEALSRRANRAGNALRALGVRGEERVLLCMLDTVDFPAVFLGAMKAGMIPVPVNTLLTTDDYAFLLNDSRARVVVVSDVLYAKLAPAIATSHHLEAVVIARTPLASTPGAASTGEHPHLDALLDAAGDSLEAAHTTSDDVAFWLYSSGSTGTPKGALHLHAHLVQTAALYARGVLGMHADDVVYSAAKLFFAYGLGNALTFPFSVGACAVLLADRPTPAAVMRILRDHRPTIFCGVPTLFASLLADESLAGDPGSGALRYSISAGEALPRAIGERWRERFGSDILDGLGSTEMLHIFLSNRHGEVRYGTSGKAVPGYELKLADDSGNAVPSGEEGVLWVRGPSSCIAYWNNRARSLSTFHGEWTRTGDRYSCDDDGYYTYGGRADDMLKVGGIWVSPFEVESALTAHETVLEAAVVGHPDADGLIKPKAFVVLKREADAHDATADALKAFVKAKLAPYKYPRWIEFSRELPKTATGKIQRYKLRA